MDKVLPPVERGSRRDMAELITMLFDDDASGRFRRDLAEKMVYTQTVPARAGFSVGGRSPYGFDRYLIDPKEKIVRKLENGETIHRNGYHVIWLPAPDDDPRMQTIHRILTMLETTPASRVARILSDEGVPSHDAGRRRKNGGIVHRVSGLWCQTTVVNIARNPLLRAVVSFGRRSMGDQLRDSADGPRELDDRDRREDGHPKVVQNPELERITASAKFEPVIRPERHEKLLATLDKRGGTQRGKPRSRKPSENPLGSRVYDMACGWPMYRTPHKSSFRYVCGLYQQGHATKCEHNHIDGVATTRFVLGSIRQRIFCSGWTQELESRLRRLAERDLRSAPSKNDKNRIEAALEDVGQQLQHVTRNMALAEGPDQYKALAGILDAIKQQQASLETELADLSDDTMGPGGDVEAQVANAMETIHHLSELGSDPENLGSIGELFRTMNVRVFCRFEKTQPKNRVIRKLAGGVVTFGTAAPPIQPYDGPTDRLSIKANTPPGTVPGGRYAPGRGRSDEGASR